MWIIENTRFLVALFIATGFSNLFMYLSQLRNYTFKGLFNRYKYQWISDIIAVTLFLVFLGFHLFSSIAIINNIYSFASYCSIGIMLINNLTVIIDISKKNQKVSNDDD